MPLCAVSFSRGRASRPADASQVITGATLPFQISRTSVFDRVTEGVMVNLPDYPAHPGLGKNSPSISDSADEIAETLRANAREGTAHVQILLNTTSVAGVEALAPVLEQLRRDTWPCARARRFYEHHRFELCD